MKKVVLLVLLVLFNLCLFINEVSAQQINNPSKKLQEFKVLAIIIDPTLKSITNTELYKNDGHPKVSEWFGFNVDKSINELKKDIKDSSHGYLDVKVSREYLDEFPTYKNNLRLSNGNLSKSYDEETYIEMGKIDDYHGDWFKMLSNDLFKQVDKIGAGNYDYEYLIQKLNLIERRNKKEFDQVWIFNTSPIGTYETMMVGKNAFWVNGSPIEYNCDNFVIAGFEIARTDSMFHSLGHLTEQLLSKVFDNKSDFYKENYYNINSKEDYQKLSYWDKFVLTSYNNNSNYTSVGNTHFPFNANQNYGYYNKDSVKTNYQEWYNYPNINGDNFIEANNDAFLKNEINDSINMSQTETKSEDRLFQRFWFSLIPHIEGYTNDGYLNNWWKYFYSLDFVKNINSNIDLNITANNNQKINVNYTINYNSGKKEIFDSILDENNVVISDKNVLDFKDGVLYSVGIGNSSVTIYYDGKPITYNITINEIENINELENEELEETKEEINKENIDEKLDNKISSKTKENNEIKNENNFVKVLIMSLIVTLVLSLIIIKILDKIKKNN